MTSGINVQEGSPFVLTDSRVDALEAVSGQADYQGLNTLSLPPLNVLGVIGIPLVLLALLLDQVQRFRQRQRGGFDRRRLPPPRPAGRHALTDHHDAAAVRSRSTRRPRRRFGMPVRSAAGPGPDPRGRGRSGQRRDRPELDEVEGSPAGAAPQQETPATSTRSG